MILYSTALLGAALAAGSGGADKPPTVFVKNTARAAALEVDNAETVICVRKRITGSRTRYEKMCMRSHEWKVYQIEQEAQAQDRNMPSPFRDPTQG